MKRVIAAALVAGIAALALPSAASAEKYLSKRQAESSAEHFVGDRYSSEYAVAYCRPQGHNQAERGYSYRRWVCGWAGEYRCEGRLLITGSRGRGYYYGHVLRGQRCPAS